MDFLMGGAINKAYFVDIEWGDHSEKSALMVIARANGAAEGVTIAGLTVELTEAVRYTELLAVPAGYQVGYFIFSSSEKRNFSFKATNDSHYYAGGKVGELSAGEYAYITIEPADLIYDEDNSYYKLYVITDKPQAFQNFFYESVSAESIQIYIDGEDVSGKKIILWPSVHEITVYGKFGDMTIDITSLSTIRGSLVNVEGNQIIIDTAISAYDYATVSVSYGEAGESVSICTDPEDEEDRWESI